LKVFAVFSCEPLFYKRSGSHSFLIFAREGELAWRSLTGYFVASCEAASLPRMLFRASLPRASEHHFLAKPAGPCSTQRSALSEKRALLRPGTIFAGIASADVPRRLASTDAPQCNASDLRAVFHPREAGLASPDAFPGIASRHDLCRHCVRRCFSAPCV